MQGGSGTEWDHFRAFNRQGSDRPYQQRRHDTPLSILLEFTAQGCILYSTKTARRQASSLFCSVLFCSVHNTFQPFIEVDSPINTSVTFRATSMNHQPLATFFSASSARICLGLLSRPAAWSFLPSSLPLDSSIYDLNCVRILYTRSDVSTRDEEYLGSFCWGTDIYRRGLLDESLYL